MVESGSPRDVHIASRIALVFSIISLIGIAIAWYFSGLPTRPKDPYSEVQKMAGGFLDAIIATVSAWTSIIIAGGVILLALCDVILDLIGRRKPHIGSILSMVISMVAVVMFIMLLG